ncbi:tRNA selenocysteine 1-associated protein 1-like [Paramormyrops kingsleyae]|uniref:tRNA selenocysteine-associated protein 1 n=1 Tax=Paramormyrops kingsleyae TaxID=1676925 RepID=A0A3B3S2K8_9TELE|nr:tRNA selenocysteine 1-associated protein 1-like [Paramormyrops kingsleyae]
MFNRMTSLWMGDLDPYMDENFIKEAFSAMGETACGVKIISHRVTGGSAGYCFVEMSDEASVDRCVLRLNGKLVPGSNPPRKFKLNYATYGKRPEAGPEYSVFVGDLTPEVDDFQLHQFFMKKYSTCKAGKVVTDQYGNSRGYGFVKFGDENEQRKALEECQNASGLGGKPIRISIAVNKGNKMNNYQQNYNYNNYNYNNYGNYNGYQQSYYQQPYQSYYPQWGYEQYSSYNYGYGPYGAPPPGPGMMPPPPPMGMPPMPPMHTDTLTPAEHTEGSAEDADEAVEDPNPQVDVDTLNRQYMERSEELYDSLMNCHWQPLDSVTSDIPALTSS